ncbi:hypothetical protein IFO70_20795 [Phormidium tenue FACHB-886]|nr:hypothetical protein [Phormidium tenue FACHB-886]
MTTNSDITTAIESLETLLKAKIRLQDAQAEAEPMLATVGLLFEPEALDEDQKNILRNGLKNLRKLLEANIAYSEAVQQAEPAKVIINQLLSSSQPVAKPTNGKEDHKEDNKEDHTNGEAKAGEAKAGEAKAGEAKAAASGKKNAAEAAKAAK